jgi:hypothetical protein
MRVSRDSPLWEINPKIFKNNDSGCVTMVLKKEGAWHMCLDFRSLNKLTIKEKFPIYVIDDLLDELSSA